EPRAEVEELLEPAAEDHSADPTAEQCADDAEEQGDEPATALLTRKDQLGDRSGDESEKKESKEAHFESPSCVWYGGLPRVEKNALSGAEVEGPCAACSLYGIYPGMREGRPGGRPSGRRTGCSVVSAQDREDAQDLDVQPDDGHHDA